MHTPFVFENLKKKNGGNRLKSNIEPIFIVHFQTSFETKSQRRPFNAQQSPNYSISPMNIPPPPPPLPSIQSHMYAGSNQDNRSHLDSMNPRHYTQQKQYQPKIPLMYSPTNYPQPHASGKFTMNEAYNKPYIKSAMSPHMRSPQHPSQQQPPKYHMDNSKSKYQPKMPFSTSLNNNYQFADTSNMNDIRMLQSLHMRRQEIIGKQTIQIAGRPFNYIIHRF